MHVWRQGVYGKSLHLPLSLAVALKLLLKNKVLGFPGGAVVRNPPANAGDMGSCPGPGRSHMLRSN